jgi:hypothetical protein
MKELNTGEDFNIKIKDHNEILKQIEEIKEFEKKYEDFGQSNIPLINELNEIEGQLDEFTETLPESIEEFTEISPESVEEFTETSPETIEEFEGSKKSFFDRFKRKESIERPLSPTVFHLKINENILENIDIKKPKIKDNKKGIFRFLKRKGKKEEGEDKSEKTSIFSKIKGGFGRIKKAIPSRQGKSEETEEEKE